MHRPTVGIIALVLLAAGVVLHWAPGMNEQSPALAAAFLRLGVVLGALWLALPDAKRKANRLLLVGLLVVAVVMALRPRLLLLALVILVVMAILRPRVKPT